MAIGNSVNDEIREQHQLIMKNKTFKEKVAYFAGYYWKQALAVIVVLIFAGSMIHTMVTRKEEALQVMFINTFVKDDLDVEAYEMEISDYLGIDTKKYEVIMTTGTWIDYENMDELSVANLQKVIVEFAGSTLDVAIIDDAYLENNKQSDMLSDLNDILPAEFLEKYADRVIYTDVADDEKGSFPVGIDVSDSVILEGGGLEAYYCFAYNTTHLDYAISYLEYLLDGIENQ